MKDPYQLGDLEPYEKPNHIKTVAKIAAVTLIFLFSMVFIGAYLPDFNEWMDRTFDKSDQQRTGVVMLCIGSVTFAVLFFTKCIKR